MAKERKVDRSHGLGAHLVVYSPRKDELYLGPTRQDQVVWFVGQQTARESARNVALQQLLLVRLLVAWGVGLVCHQRCMLTTFSAVRNPCVTKLCDIQQVAELSTMLWLQASACIQKQRWPGAEC